MAYKLSTVYRTKTEARDAVKRGEILHIIRPDGTILDKANGDGFPISGKLDHYKEWTGRANVWSGKVTRIV